MRTKTILLAMASMASIGLFAQNEVSVMPVITPPYSIYLSDYQGSLMVSLTNQTMQPLELKLLGTLAGDNGYSARTNGNYAPASPIQLGALETMVLYANSPALSFIDPNNLQISAPQQVQDAVMQTGILPEGNYSLCIQAVDYYTNAPLSQDEPAGCIFFPIANVQPPTLTFPLCDDTLDTQWPVFTWSPPIGNINLGNVQYDLYILELLAGQNPHAAMGLAIDGISGNPIVRRDLAVPTYPWQPYDPTLNANTAYAMAVVARDLSNTTRIENKGRSEVCTFTIRPLHAGAPTPATPIATGPIREHLPIGPINNTRIKGRLVYQFKEDAHQDCGKENIDGTGIGPVVTLMPGIGTAATNGGAQPSPNGFRPPSTMGGSPTNTASSPPTMGPFNFSAGTPGHTSPPTVNGAGYHQIDIAKLLGPPGYKWQDPNPIAPVRSKPMKNIPIRLVERVVLTNVDATEDWRNPKTVPRVIYGVDPLPADAARVTGLDKTTWAGGKVLATGTTDENGEYSFFYNQTDNMGVPFAQDPEANLDAIIDMLQGTNAGGVIQHNAVKYTEASGMQRILMIEVLSPYYCSPDLEIYVQPSDDVELPEQVCYVRSYNMEVQVNAGNCASQMGGSGGVLGGVEVVLARKTDHAPKTLPQGEGQDADELVNSAFGQIPLVSRCVSSSSDGKTLFRNLVCHGRNVMDEYYLALSTDKDRGLLNYGNKALAYPESDFADSVPVVGGSWSKPELFTYLRNSSFKVNTYPVPIVMTPSPPRVVGRAMVGTAQPLANAKVKLKLRYDKVSDASERPVIIGSCEHSTASADFTTMELVRNTDANGYFSFTDIPVKVTKDAGKFLGPHAVVEVSQYGFRSALRPLPASSSIELRMGQQWDMTSGILMEPLGKVVGTIQDEDGKPVRCDVRVGEGPWVRTSSAMVATGAQNPSHQVSFVEKFTAPAPASTDPNSPYQLGQDIKVVPLSDQYFPLTVSDKLIYPNADGSPVDLGTLTVKEKKHRVHIVLLENMQRLDGQPVGAPVANANVRFGDQEGQTNASGEVAFNFRTPASEFRLRITAGNFRPVDSLVVNNVTPQMVTIAIDMKQGRMLAGTVVDEEYQPIGNARVWVEMGADDYGPQLNQTTTDASGKFTLFGVPSTTYTVHAAKYDPAISYIGASQQVAPPSAMNPISVVSLMLKKDKTMDLTSIYGFPVEVTKQVNNSDGTRTINGAFVHVPGNANFRPRDPDQRIPFNQLKIKAGPPNPNGVPRATPVSGPVLTDLLRMEMKLYTDLDVTLESLGSVLSPSPMIKVKGTSAGGDISGLVGTKLSSFNFSYDFTGRFYLGDGPEQPMLKVLSSKEEYPQRQFNLMTRGTSGRPFTPAGQWAFIPADPTFSLRGFAARGDRTRSFVEPDVFHIATVLQIKDIPDLTPQMLELNVGEVRVLKETIEGLSGGGDKLSFALNNWTFESTGPWAFNSDIASIVIPKGILKMADDNGKMLSTAHVQQVLIRPNALNMDISGLGDVLLGGVAPVKPLPDAPWTFGYDAGYMYRGKAGAWRLGALSTGKRSVATLQGPAELVPSQLELSSFSMVSRGMPLAELKAQDYRYHDILTMTPVGTFAATPDGVDLDVNCSMAIHGFPTTTGRFSFFNQNGKATGRLKPLGATIKTGRGGVDFILDDKAGIQVFGPGKFTTFGQIWMPPEKGKPGNPIMVRGFLTHTKTKTDLEVILVDSDSLYRGTNRQAIRMGGSDDKKLLVKKGGQSMGATQWDELSFVGNLAGMDNIKDDPSNELTFAVKGAVTMDKGALKMDSLSTPFGDLTMSFDFIQARLLGSLTLKTVDMGAVRIDTAQLNLLVDRNGFLISCTKAEVTIRSVPKPFDHHFPSFMIGAHEQIPPELLTQMMANYRLKTLPQHLVDHHILGLFLQNKMDLFSFELPKLNLVLFSMWGHAHCAAEAQVWVDLSDGASLGLAGVAYADISCGFSVILVPCDLLVNVTASLGFDVRYENELFTVSGCAGIVASAEVCDAKESTDIIVRLSVNSDGDMLLERSDEPCVSSATKEEMEQQRKEDNEKENTPTTEPGTGQN